MISVVNSHYPVAQNKPVQFKGEQTTTEPVVDKEKSNATKLMIGATALAGVVALGIAGYKGKLGKTVQELLGGAEKTVQKTVEKEVPKPPKEVKVKPSKYKDFTGVVDTKNAKVTFENGRVVDGLAGGICQVSTTIYNAALYSNMEIVERKNHMFPVSYAPKGQDATVVMGSIDFKFRNSTSNPIKLT